MTQEVDVDLYTPRLLRVTVVWVLTALVAKARGAAVVVPCLFAGAVALIAIRHRIAAHRPWCCSRCSRSSAS